jgi:MscS family membrane protein
MNTHFLEKEFLGNTVESYLWFAGILLAGLIFKQLISHFISWVAYRLIKKYSKGITFKDFKTLLLKPGNWVILLVVFYLAFDRLSFPTQWDLDPVDKPGLRSSIFILFQILITGAFAWTLLRFIDFIGLILIKRAETTESKLDDQFVPYIKSGLKIIVAITTVFFALGFIFKVNIIALVGGLGIGGLALALAGKETVENLFGSFTIFFDKPFTVGDHVKVGNVEGFVESIGLRSTRIRTLERSLLTIPNKKMIDAELENVTLRNMWRARFFVALTYSTSTEQLKAVIKDIYDYIHAHPQTRDHPIVKFSEFNSSSLDVLVVYFVLTSELETFLNIKEEINFKIMEIVKQHGCSFAFPSTSVYLEKRTESQDL